MRMEHQKTFITISVGAEQRRRGLFIYYCIKHCSIYSQWVKPTHRAAEVLVIFFFSEQRGESFIFYCMINGVKINLHERITSVTTGSRSQQRSDSLWHIVGQSCRHRSMAGSEPRQPVQSWPVRLKKGQSRDRQNNKHWRQQSSWPKICQRPFLVKNVMTYLWVHCKWRQFLL